MRKLQISKSKMRKDETVNTTVRFQTSEYNEVAMSFSIAYDSQNLQFRKAFVGTKLDPNVGFAINHSVPGQIGIEIDSGSPLHLEKQAIYVLVIVFVRAPTAQAIGYTLVTFADSPAHQAVSDPEGNHLETVYLNGSVKLG